MRHNNPLEKQTRPLCVLANLSHETTDITMELAFSPDSPGTGPTATVSAAAEANITPRNSLRARLQGSRRIITPVTATETISQQGSGEKGPDPLAYSRTKAVGEVIFQHLAINCIDCPLAPHCDGPQEMGQLARELTNPTNYPTATHIIISE